MSVKIAGTTSVVARLLRYTVKDKAGQIEPRVLHIAGIDCRPETVEREFAATRRKFGTQGAVRLSPAKYELPAPGEVATHIRKTRPNGRRVWTVAKSHETATHLRREGEVVRQAEGRHLITSFGLDEVNPDDPEQVARAFEYTAAEHAALYPGEQVLLVGQADGKGKNFHVHVTRNATLFADMVVDGVLHKAGAKLAGDLTDIDKVRARADAFLAEHGSKYGFRPQRLAAVAERKQETRNARDRSMAAKGERSNHDVIRDAFELSLADPRAVELDGFVEVMQEHGVTAVHRVTRAGQPGEKHALSYRLSDMPQNVRGTTLGEYYSYDSAIAQLEANAAGRPRKPRPERMEMGPVRPVAVPDDAELADARETVAQLAAAERAAHILELIDADFFDAAFEDYDAAIDADVAGDHEEMTRLATITREKRATEKVRVLNRPKAKASSTREGKADPQSIVESDEHSTEQVRPPEVLKELKMPVPDADPTGSALVTSAEVETIGTAALPLVDEDDENTVEKTQTVELKSAAPAPVQPITPITNERPYVSKLRGMRMKNPKAQPLVDAMADFDENARAALLRGERIIENDIPKGIGPAFLEAHSDNLDPRVFKQLQLRAAKKKRANRRFEEGKDVSAKLVAMRKAAEQQGDLTDMWAHGSDAIDLISTRNTANRKLIALREQIAAGVYEEVQGIAWRTTILESAGTETVVEQEPRSL